MRERDLEIVLGCPEILGINWRSLTFLVDRYFTGMNYGPHLGKVLVARLALLFIRNNHIQIEAIDDEAEACARQSDNVNSEQQHAHVCSPATNQAARISTQ